MTRLILGCVMAAAVFYWFLFWIERWFHVRRHVAALFPHLGVHRETQD